MSDSHHKRRPSNIDPTLEAEWKRLESERLAEERAEARVDAEEAAEHPSANESNRRLVVLAFAVALMAGGMLAFLVNRPGPGPVTEPEKVAVVRRAVDEWAEANRIDEAALRAAGVRRIMSTAAVPSDQLSIRVLIRDDRGRDRLESLLAASGLRIESDGDTSAESEAVIDSLAVSGKPSDIDALLDRLIASPTMLEVYSPALLASIPKDAVIAEHATDDVTAPPPSAADAPAAPPRVWLRVEVVEVATNPVSGEQPAAERAP